jgi:hypothetical protein
MAFVPMQSNAAHTTVTPSQHSGVLRLKHIVGYFCVYDAISTVWVQRGV